MIKIKKKQKQIKNQKKIHADEDLEYLDTVSMTQ